MPRRPLWLTAALVTTTIVVSGVLGALAWRLIDQQHALDEQRARDQLERSADTISARVSERLAAAGERLTTWAAEPSPPAAFKEAVIVSVTEDDTTVEPRGGLPFLPHVPRGTAVPSAALAVAEAAELRDGDRPRAMAMYRALARAGDPPIKAVALMRLAALLRGAGDVRGALACYRTLASMGDIPAEQLPAELVGLYGQRAILQALRDPGEAAVASDLVQKLDRGEWRLLRGTAELYRDEFPAVVEDAPGIAMALEDDLRLEGYDVEVVGDGAAAVRRAREGSFDAILLDVMLPVKDGFEVCRELRRGGVRAPILMLTALAQESEKVLAFELGADDYVTKPFGVRELRARIAALIRRTRPEPDQAVVRIGDAEIDFGRGEIRRGASTSALTPLEFKLLQAFAAIARADSHPFKYCRVDGKRIYQQIVREYGDQRDASATARARLQVLPQAVRTGAVNRQLWTSADVQGHAISADGRLVSSCEGGDVVVREVATQRERRPATAPRPASGDYADTCVISRQGTQVAYSWANHATLRYELRVVAAAGGESETPRVIVDNSDVEFITPLDWSPDGRTLAVRLTRGVRTTQLAFVSVRDGASAFFARWIGADRQKQHFRTTENIWPMTCPRTVAGRDATSM